MEKEEKISSEQRKDKGARRKKLINTDIDTMESHRGEQRLNEEKGIQVWHNPKVLFLYMNKAINEKAEIGPCKVGERYECHPRRICKKLIDQYKSVIS